MNRSGDFGRLRGAVAKCRPEAVIEQYVHATSHGGMSRSEQGSLVSMNLRWLPCFIGLRQAMALEPVRIKFGPTEHEPLAQGAGRLTFFVDQGARSERVDVFQRAGAKGVLELVYPVKLESPGAVEVRLTPITGRAVLSAAMLEPA